MRIDVWSDVVCPWCYLGARRLREAVEELGWADEVEIHWRAYQLDPTAPKEPQDLRTAIEHKYGQGAFDAMTRKLTNLGAEVGIDYRFDLAKRVNTSDAHRLLAWAGASGHEEQNRLADELFAAYFTRGEDVAEIEVLVRAAKDAGLDADEARVVAIDPERFADEVRSEIDQALDKGITGVPAFVIEDTWMVPGAQDVDTFIRVLQRARKEMSAA